jgi:hypothetical protein
MTIDVDRRFRDLKIYHSGMDAPVKKEEAGGLQHPEYALLDTSNRS